MTIEICLAFAPAYVVLLLIPGPTVSLVFSYAIGQGWRAALPTAIGVAIGDFIAMTASMLGVGALLATSATFFNVLKWLGAAYLIWLGIKLWQSGTALRTSIRHAREHLSTVAQAGRYAVNGKVDAIDDRLASFSASVALQ